MKKNYLNKLSNLDLMTMKIIILLSCLFIYMDHAESHSWMSCPPSFNTQPLRGGLIQPICESGMEGAPITHVKAGDRLKVGWTPNNHAGGFVRISLVPEKDYNDTSVAKLNVLKFVCYGHDEREGKTRFGDCIHPCNARGGCSYPTVVEDKERFDTTIGIPTNLEDGIYVLQTAMLVGNGISPYYSCGKLSITGGNTAFECQSNEDPITYKCLKSGGPDIIGHSLHSGTRRGNFCFHLDGRRGTVDDNYSQVPVNVKCDPRITCGLSVDNPRCHQDALSMKNIKFDSLTKEPYQETCDDMAVNSIKTSSPVTRSSTEQKTTDAPITEPQVITTTERQSSSSTEEATSSSTIVSTTMGIGTSLQYYNQTTIHSAWVVDNQAVFAFQVHFLKQLPPQHCWQLLLQFQYPFKIASTGVWNGGQLVGIPNIRSLMIESRRWTRRAGPSKKIIVGMRLINIDESITWTEENMKFITAMVEVKPLSDCVIKN